MNLITFTQKYATVEACLKHLEAVRWFDGEFCPHCGSSEKIYHYSDGKRHRCKACKHVFRITTGTLFGDSPLKMLPQWFMAIYFETVHSKGISSMMLAKHIGVTQKTAWFMLHRIRNATTANEKPMLNSIIEIDEKYLGGKEKNKHASKRTPGSQGGANKTVVFGIRKRGGEARAFKVPSAKARDLIPELIKNVAVGADVHADDATAYAQLESFYRLATIQHSKGEYVRGNVHTNGIESIWAMVQRTYEGTHHWWSEKYTQRYLDTICNRINQSGKDQAIVIDDLLDVALNPNARLTHAELVA